MVRADRATGTVSRADVDLLPGLVALGDAEPVGMVFGTGPDLVSSQLTIKGGVPLNPVTRVGVGERFEASQDPSAGRALP